MKAWICQPWRSYCHVRRGNPAIPYHSRLSLSGSATWLSRLQFKTQHTRPTCRFKPSPLCRRHLSAQSVPGRGGHPLTGSYPPPPADYPKKVEAWVAMIEPYFPDGIRGSQVSHSMVDVPFLNITEIIARARQTDNIDLVASLGVEQKRWDAVQWICKGLIEQVGPPKLPSKQTELMSNVNLPCPNDSGDLPPTSVSLDDITQQLSNSKLDIDMGLDLEAVGKGPIVSINKTLDDLMAPPMAKSTAAATAILGDIWETLGNLILAATSHSSQTSEEIMPNVLRIIANLHHNGWIPEAVYHDSHNTDPSALQQPPLLSELSSLMISALTEAAYSGEGGIGPTSRNKKFLKSRIFSKAPDKIPNVGPEIWLEFCLWCCVHGGWVHQGSAILNEMRKVRGQFEWSLIYWRDILESPEEKWEEFTQRRLKTEHGRSIENPSRRDLVQRTISAEVVIAVIDGLVADMLSSDANTPSNHRSAGRIVQLKRLLDAENMSLGLSSWDAVIARIADVSYIDTEANPAVMGDVLKLTEIYGQEIHSFNAPKSGEDTDPVASYVFDASAAVIGLYHRTLHAYIKGRDAAPALRILNKLQSLTDVNKMRSVEEFFRELQETTVEETTDAVSVQEPHQKVFSFHDNVYSKFPGVQYPGYFPAIPITILADLLDLLVDSDNHEVAHYMLYSQDVDGPLIPESMYSNQLIAPALIKYAAAIQDPALLLKITEAQNSDISGPTLVALCQSRIWQRNFTGAIEVLNLIRDYSIHEWKPEESAVLVQLLLQLTHESPNVSSFETIQLLQQMLHGRFGKQWGQRSTQLDTVIGVLSDFSPDVRRICAGLLQSGSYYRMDMTTETFNVLLDGAIRTVGHDAGRRLIQDWCLNVSHSHEIIIDEDGRISQPTRASPAEKFLGTGQQEYKASTVVFEGIIQYNVATIRTVIDGVLRENAISRSTSTTTPSADNAATSSQPAHDDVPQSVDLFSGSENVPYNEADEAVEESFGVKFDRQHPIMEWAVTILRQDFNMTYTDIDYMTRGYLTSQHLELTYEQQQMYSTETIRMWRTLQATRKLWAKTQEGRLRAFATNQADRQLVVVNVPVVERYFLQCLAKDIGLVTSEYGEEAQDEKDVKLTKSEKELIIPSRTIGEVLRMQASMHFKYVT